MSKLTAVKVFDIPELAILVIGHLERSDLAACALVHRTWHKSVIPSLYSSFMFRDRYRGPFKRTFSEDSWDAFKKHSSHIRVLEISSRVMRDTSLFDFNCTNLKDLHLYIQLSANPSKTAQWSLGLLKLISNNPSISTLRITAHDEPVVNDIDHHLVVLHLLRHMPALKRLVIAGPNMGQSSVDEIMRCAYRLEELDLILDRINEHPTPRPSRSPIGSDLESYLARLCLKNHDDAGDTSDGPYILDTQGHRCRQGTSLKRFGLTLENGIERDVRLADASPLVRLCCSAENIQLSISDVMKGPSRRNSILTLHEQVGHPAWCLRHLDIGSLWHEDSSVLVKILSASASPLISLRLWDVSFTYELLSVLLLNHGKTLQRVTVGQCPDLLSQANIKALVSGCPSLLSLDLCSCDRESAYGARLQDASVCQWRPSDGRVFKMFISDEAYYDFQSNGYYSEQEYSAFSEEPIPDDPWVHLDLMSRPDFQSRVRFVAN
ncbi:hypothetical protein BGZ72_010875 [Mortierella alpina]|nr:hypothetical protein BGZ72_010875 [Mortierella alpina]